VQIKYYILTFCDAPVPTVVSGELAFNLALYIILRDPSQKSAPVTLSRGQVYYIEALMKERRGGDHISVGVKLPSGVLQRPISNNDVYIKPPGKQDRSWTR
jgi:hypothetical protein